MLMLIMLIPIRLMFIMLMMKNYLNGCPNKIKSGYKIRCEVHSLEFINIENINVV